MPNQPSAEPKKKKYTYPQFKKRFTNREQIEMIAILSKDWMCDPGDVVDRVICEGLARERDKRREVNQIKNSYRS